MQIQHKDANKRGIFFIEDDGEIVAEIVYASGGNNTIIIEHTEVDESLRGKNIGYELVKKIVDHARSNGLKVVPVCPFAKAVFDKHADWADLTPNPSPGDLERGAADARWAATFYSSTKNKSIADSFSTL